jgi:hypothetical protein
MIFEKKYPMKHFLFLYFLFTYLDWNIEAQVIHGTITDSKKLPLPGCNIYIKGSYDGTISNADGTYNLKTSMIGQQSLIVTIIGFESFETSLLLTEGKDYPLDISLKDKHTQLNEVVITAGTFEAGDKKRGIQLQAMDILTTANSNGDIMGALNTLPGTQTVGEEGALFVRGGEKNETKTFVDGLLVSNPYTSKVPDLPMRGRFSPSLFSGVSFSSGGYSAEYGQALSSALILQTFAFPTKSFTSLSFFPFGTGLNHTWKGDSTSFSFSADYHNLKPYYAVVKQNTNWTHSPESLHSDMMFRKKLGKQGFLKSFGSFGASRLGLILPAYLATNDNTDLALTNKDFYINSVYTNQISSQWALKAGGSLNYDDELVHFNHYNANTYNRVAQFRSTLQNNLTPGITIKIGGEFTYQHYRQEYLQKDTGYEATLKFESPLPAMFAETEWKISNNLFSRLGVRAEYSGLLHEAKLVPRISMAYKTSENSQISMAYGIFNQLPMEDYIKFNRKLNSEKATHYIVNYQYTKNERLFRVEAFDKEYKNLVRYDSLNDPNPDHYNNKGHGYARGFEVFVRDQKSIKNGDYWISYTYLDTKKLNKDLPVLEQPYLFSKHSLSIVGKHYFSIIHSQLGMTYQYNSGRPYYSPTIENNQQHFTKDDHNLSLNCSYLTKLLNCFTIVHLSVNNVLGFNQIFGYHYSKLPSDTETRQPDENGYYKYAVTPAAKRFIVLGVFMTLDKYYTQY